MNLSYGIESPLQNIGLLDEMSALYSEHYGLWGSTAPKPRTRIKLSAKRMSYWTSRNNNIYIATARYDGTLIGYAIATVASTNKREPLNKSKIISWVTQLVVHQDYREQGVAKSLLLSFWGLSDYYAWGILSSNPYAIKALESATRRVATPSIINKEKHKIIPFGEKNIHYINKNTEFVIDYNTSKANTDFPSDISNISSKLENVENKSDIKWIMGNIDEGWEWFAFTFNTQERKKLSKNEINQLLKSFDDMAKDAYSRMLMDNKHVWSKHTKKEVDFIIKECNLSSGASVLDFGCGTGRHSITLGDRNLHATGVDYTKELLQKAEVINTNNFVVFKEGDCRIIDLEQEYDTVLCLYDVIGSFADENENLKILKNIYKHTKKQGNALISVMNYELTEINAKHTFDFEEKPDDIFNIPPSSIMESTGDIFNPDHYTIDKKTHIVYRREQFTSGSNLPRELIVRDKRYTQEEIMNLCKSVGFKVIFSRYVQAGRWDTELQPTDEKAKEILLLCQKS